jgi:hypothetical protein
MLLLIHPSTSVGKKFVTKNPMPRSNLQQLVQFLKEDCLLPSEPIQVAIKQSQREHGPLPMVLWRYGFITLEQLDRVQQWLLQHPSVNTGTL